MTSHIPVSSRKHMRKLEELNLMDDFLFQEMLSQEDTGEEFARILLGTILGKPIRRVKIVPQRNILGIDTDRHGIRLTHISRMFPMKQAWKNSTLRSAQISMI